VEHWVIVKHRYAGELYVYRERRRVVYHKPLKDAKMVIYTYGTL
jgi:hypothetical protein